MDSDDESCSDNSDSELAFCLEDDYKFQDIILDDDNEKFVSRINRHWGRHPVVPPQHLDWIFRFRAIKCATALLGGETGQTMDFYCTLFLGLPAIHSLAQTCDGALIELFIHHGAPLDHRCYGLGPNNASLEGKLPLNAALQSLVYGTMIHVFNCLGGAHLIKYRFAHISFCSHNIFYEGWNPSRPLFEMLVLLCSRFSKKDVTKGIRLLVLNTKEAELEICQYAKEGKVVELAALLMTAREKVAPILYEIGDGSTSNGGMSIRQCIYRKLAALTYEESKFTFCNEKKLIRDCKEKKMAYMSTVELLDIFEMAGDTIETYIRLRQQQDEDMAEEQVAVDFSWLLQGARLLPKYKGVNLSKLWSRPERHLGYIQPTKYATNTRALVTRKLRDGKVNDNTKQKSIIVHTGVQHGSPTLPLLTRSFHTMRAPLSSQSTNFVEAQVKKTTKPRNRYMPKKLSCQRWTPVVIAIKLGIRHL
ncbi:hypothetical protein ACSBR1_021110 [Camellia fascicularis]